MLCGWLSPEGDFYPCGPYGHIDLANELADSLYLNVGTKDTEDDFLLSAQWIKLFCDGLVIGNRICLNMPKYNKKQITDAQITWITGHQHKLSAKQLRCLCMYLELEGYE